jgi:hypothetical protein
MLADQYGCGHRESKHPAQEQKHHRIGVGSRGERRFAQELAHPNGIDRAVQGLQHIAAQDRQREQQESAT